MIRPNITLTGYVSLGIQNSAPTNIRSYATRFTAPANTDTFVSVTIPGDQVQALLSGNVYSMRACWCFGAGSTFQGTTGQWVNGNTVAGSDVTNLASTAVGNNVILSGAVMLPGIVPISQAMLPLLARRYDDELRLCQRYFWNLNYLAGGYIASSGVSYGTLPFPATMRTTPSTALNSPYGSNGGTLQTNGVDPLTWRWQLIGSAGTCYGGAALVFNARM